MVEIDKKFMAYYSKLLKVLFALIGYAIITLYQNKNRQGVIN